jgi:UrcA family protein
MLFSTFRRMFLLATGAAVATTLALGASLAPAFAKEVDVIVTAETDPRPTRLVQYVDLNLGSVHGEKTLLRRVSGAVDSVCSYRGSILFEYQENRACRAFAWAGARPQIAAAIDRARSGNSLAAAAIAISVAGK